MNDFLSTLLYHKEKYPHMGPVDAVKLAYQSEFGGGHLITDMSACQKRLLDEYASASYAGAPLIEDIGGGMVRIDLGTTKEMGISPKAILMVFAASSEKKGSLNGLKQKLEVIKNSSLFEKDELESYLKEYAAAGYPMISHSDLYRREYSPSYRVCTEPLARLLPLVSRMLSLKEQKERITVAIDGRAASGKSTAADNLKKLFAGELGIIHMDDFFLPLELRTPERYAEPGGNIHYERFEEEIISSLNKEKLTYKKFDCSVCDYTETVTCDVMPITVIEGSYSAHPRYRDRYDITVFSDISPKEQMDRIIERNGIEWGNIFRDKWIPLEEKYFESCGVKENCMLTI